jgi:hypothetical protein
MVKAKKVYAILGTEDAESIFQLAKEFYNNGRRISLRYTRLKKKGNDDIINSNVLAVAATNVTLSFELYFKGLSLVSTGKYDTIHGLAALFQKLPLEIKTDIKFYFEKERNKARGDLPIIRRLSPLPSNHEYSPWDSEITLDVFLTTHNDGFVEWRYHFQPELQKTIYADFALMAVLNKAILKIVKKYT